MAGAAILAIALSALHLAGPTLLREVPALLAAREADMPAARLVDELSLYRAFFASRDNRAMTRLRLAIVQQSPALPRKVRAALTPLWSARTRWQLELSIALIETQIETGAQH